MRYVNGETPTLIYERRQNKIEPQRVYQENTFIDWSLETLVVSDYKKWLLLVISAVILGYIAAFIDLISVSLNDLKKGLCLSNTSEWTLLNPYSSCPEWSNWNELFHLKGTISHIFINFPIYLAFATLYILIASYTSKHFSIKQSGIPEIKLIISGLNLNMEYLGAKTLVYKILGLIFAVGSGLWLGKEGPLVHISCCIFNVVYQLFQFDNEAIRREILCAATATGISVAFDSPIGGVLFVLESFPSYFMPTKIMWNSFVSATISVITLTGFKVFTDGRNFFEKDLFSVNFGNFSWLFMEVVPFIMLGIIGGVYGWLTNKLNLKIKRNKIPYENLILVIVTTLLNFPLELTKLPFNAYLKEMFKDQSDFVPNSGISAVKLLYIIIQGFFLTTYTFGVDLPGGILMPSLVLGATTGRFLGILFQILQSKFQWDSLATCTEKSCLVDPSSYAVIGAAAFMTGITKLTMCVVVIMFEMTGAVSYVLPIMCGVMTSKFINDWLQPLNMYDDWLQENFNTEKRSSINQGKGTGLVSFSNLTTTLKSKLPDITVGQLMIPIERIKCLCLVPDEPYTQDYLVQFIQDNHEGYPLIINYQNPVYIGYVSKIELDIYSSDQTPISFQISNLPKSALSMQLHFEQRLNSNFRKINLTIQPSTLLINDLSPAILILEQFEKLHLNYLIILNHQNTDEISGFIDRFILNKIINEQFTTIKFDLESGSEELAIPLRINRKSIELIT